MTGPSADAAKLLQKQIAHVIADCDGTDCLSRAKTIMDMVENSRPQPAAPEGEPDDWTGVQKRIAETMCDTVNMATGEATRQARISEADWTRIKTFIRHVGLAARPKVEDAK